MQINTQTLLTIGVFILIFVSVGWAAPILYVDFAPNDRFIEMHSFEVEDTHVNASEHNLCLNRTVHKPSNADITVEMHLIRDDGVVVERDSFEVDAYYQDGHAEVVIPREIRADNLEPGTYRYVESTELTYYDGRATKEITFTSEEFTVYESSKEMGISTNDTGC